MNQITLQASQIMLVPHPSILENLESLDLENGTVADIANIGIELAAFVQIDEVPIDGTSEKLIHDASIANAEDARSPHGRLTPPQGYKNAVCFERPATAFLALP
jgi:hypothetical protein